MREPEMPTLAGSLSLAGVPLSPSEVRAIQTGRESNPPGWMKSRPPSPPSPAGLGPLRSVEY